MIHIELVPKAEAADVVSLVKSVDKVVINPIIIFLFALAMAYFLYGLAQFFWSPDNEEIKKTSKSHMVWGLLGLFVMVAVFGIMNLILNTFQIKNVKIQSNGNYTVTNPSNSSDTYILNGNKDISTLKPPQEADIIDTSKTVDLSTSTAQDSKLDPTESPFPDYIKDSSLCWSEILSSVGKTEYLATHPTYNGQVYNTIQSYVRAYYLYTAFNKQNININDAGLPIIYDYESLYDKVGGGYYIWLDVRAPTLSGKISDCSFKINPKQSSDNYKYLNSYKASNINLSSVTSSSITDFTKSPFPTYIQNTSCWRDEVSVTDKLEYSALQALPMKARQDYLDILKLSDSKDNANYPINYGIQIAFNPKDQLYYAWEDIRAPYDIKNATKANCNFPVKVTLPEPQDRSNKSSSLTGTVGDDANFYRVVDSGVSLSIAVARNTAINNALIQIAKKKGLGSVQEVKLYKVLQPEKYFPPDPVTGNYDYFVAVESPR